MYPYFHAANDFGCSLYVVECHGQYGNLHNVSEETIQKMKGRWANVDDINFYGENFQRLKTLRVLPSDNIWATLDLA
jgi:hypothetical protein